MRSIRQILMNRDGMTASDADDLIYQASEQFDEYLTSGELEYAYNICSEYFGLEPDYLDEFINKI